MPISKRLFDLTIASLGLMVLFPLMAIIALAIWLTMGGPVLFRQRRPGQHGEPFELLKFRTMNQARDEQGQLLVDTQRLTRLGKVLRETSLDELPELVNVIKGDMSLVGPRPLLMKYLDRYTPEQARRHEVKPGITGLAQVNGRNSITWDEKFRYDVVYVESRSLWLDWKILVKTFVQVVRRTGVNSSAEETMPEFLGTAATPSRIYLSPPHMTSESRELLIDAFDSNWIAPLGPHVDQFEAEFADYLGGGYAVALSSGTAALHLALLSVGIQPGDRVATSSLTFAATANAIRYVGAIPMFIDSETQSWNLDPQLLAEELEESIRRGQPIKAVMAVDLLGQCADYHAIRPLCDFYEIPLVEDAAESLGSFYAGRPAGTWGDIGCFSFNGNKIITTSGGGMLVTSDRETAERVRYLASQARQPVAHYEHIETGYNYRMSNLLAAVGRGQLRVLPQYVAKRRANFEFYRRELGELPGIELMPEIPEGISNRWLSAILVRPAEFGCTAAEIRLALEHENIEARQIWKPLHEQLAFADCSVRGGRVSERLFATGLCLPSGSNLSSEDLRRITGVVQQLCQRKRPTSATRPAVPSQLESPASRRNALAERSAALPEEPTKPLTAE